MKSVFSSLKLLLALWVEKEGARERQRRGRQQVASQQLRVKLYSSLLCYSLHHKNHHDANIIITEPSPSLHHDQCIPSSLPLNLTTPLYPSSPQHQRQNATTNHTSIDTTNATTQPSASHFTALHFTVHHYHHDHHAKLHTPIFWQATQAFHRLRQRLIPS